MPVKSTTARALFCVMIVAAFAPAASAYCDLLSYSSNGVSTKDALSKANAAGLAEVHLLNAKYGSSIKYDKATWTCSSAHPVSCTISQRYCIAGLGPAGQSTQVTIPGGCPYNLDKVCTRTPSGDLINCHCQS